MRPPRERRGAPRRLTRSLDALLVLLAIAGALVLAWRLIAAALGLQLVWFETGSMAPAYPQHAIAVAEPVRAADVRVGDVVTIDRGGALQPITHRVVEVRQEGVEAVLRLRGDANRRSDPTVYRVQEAHRVVLLLPPAFGLVRLAETPQAGLVAMVLAGGAVLWALWPRARRRPPTSASRSGADRPAEDRQLVGS